MKRIIKVICFVLVFVNILSLNIFAKGNNYYYSEQEWSSYWNNNKDNTCQMIITPGNDETSMNFQWHSKIKIETQVLLISKSERFNDYNIYYPKTTLSNIEKEISNKVTVDNLLPDSIYYYRYGTLNNLSDIHSFKTNNSNECKFIFVSDPQIKDKEDLAINNSLRWNNLLNTAVTNNDDIDFIVCSGDLTHNNKPSEWAATLSSPVLRDYSFAAIPGNHDKKNVNFSSFINYPNKVYGLNPTIYAQNYYFKSGDTLFIMMNSNNDFYIDQYNFMTTACNAFPDCKWRIVVMHNGIYGSGDHADLSLNPDNYELACGLGTLMDIFDIDMVLDGHDHIYGRSYFMEDNRILDTDNYSTGVVNNPEGVIYVDASASAGNNNVPEKSYGFDYLAFDYISDVCSFSIIETTENSIIINTYLEDTNEKIDSFTINKTEDRKNGDNKSFGKFYVEYLERLTRDRYNVLNKLILIIQNLL